MCWPVDRLSEESDFFTEESGECTIGVASGTVTSDGRPLLWKTRDSTPPDNEVCFETSYAYKFVAVMNAGDTLPWMGVNERGFAILNSNSTDLPAANSDENGPYMRLALGTCATAADFEHLLDRTNDPGRLTQANFAVIDSTGAAAIYETAACRYWKFDANNPQQTPEGYVLRANFAVKGGGTTGIGRHRRTCAIISNIVSQGQLNYRTILREQMRDFADTSGNPFPVPFPHQAYPPLPEGYIRTSSSICRFGSVSGAIIEGVSPGESALLTTLWAVLGQPATGISVPYWPVGKTPSLADGEITAPLCDLANKIKSIVFVQAVDPTTGQFTEFVDSYKLLDQERHGVWAHTLPVEGAILDTAEEALGRWRTTSVSVEEMLYTERVLTRRAYDALKEATAPEPRTELPRPNAEKFSLDQNYPNPFNPRTEIGFTLAVGGSVSLKVYNTLGQEVATLVNETRPAGVFTVQFDGGSLASGLYFCRMQAGSFVQTKKLVVLK